MSIPIAAPLRCLRDRISRVEGAFSARSQETAEMMHLDRQPDFLLTVSRRFLWNLVLIALAILLVVFARRVLLTLFLGILLAVVLRAASDLIQRVTNLRQNWAYTVTIVGLIFAVAALVYLLGPQVLIQGHELSKTVPKALGTAQEELTRYQWGRDVLKVLASSTQPEQIAARVKAYGTDVFSGVTTCVAIVAIALFLGANPRFYRDGALRLVPDGSRAKATTVLKDLTFTMKWWLIGQLIPMTALGAGTMVSLAILGIPLAFTLGLFTASMLFVPYVGSVIAYIPTALVALAHGPEKLLWVTVLYVGVHMTEAYVITPIVQRRAVKLAPALTLTAQLFVWEYAGLLGVLAATPLAAATLVLVQRLYLHEQPEING